MSSWVLGVVTMLCLVAACLLLTGGALAGDEDFYGVEGRPVALNVTVDPGAPVDMWWWDFEGDGCFTWSSSVGPNTTHVYPEPGLYHPVLKALNGTQFVRAWIYQALIEPENRPPQVHVPDAYLETFRGETVTFTGTATDDGAITLYEWDFDGDGTFDYRSELSAAATWVYRTTGPHSAVLRVTDDQGVTGTATVTVVVGNRPPTVQANDIISDQVEVVLAVTASDPDGELASFTWEPGDGSPNVTTAGPTLAHSYPGVGSFPVNVSVLDDDDGSATARFTVTIVEPWVQHRVVATASAYEVMVGEPITFEAEIIEGTPPSAYTTDWNLGDGNRSTALSFSHTYGQAGTYQVHVVVTDARDLSVHDELSVRVLWTPNEAPVAVPSVEQWVLPGRNTRFSDASYDPDGWIVLWQWDFDGDGTFDRSNTTDGNHTHVYPEEGVFTAVLRVTDNRGEVGVATVVIKVDRDAPEEDPVDDSQGAAVCCAVTVVVLVAVAYWAVRRSMATPRKDGGPRADPGDGPDDGGEDGAGDGPAVGPGDPATGEAGEEATSAPDD